MNQNRTMDFTIRNKVRNLLGKKVMKIGEQLLQDGARKVKLIALSGNNKNVFVTKELVLVDGTKFWRNIGMSLA